MKKHLLLTTALAVLLAVVCGLGVYADVTVHGTARALSKSVTGEYGRLIWRQTFDNAATIGDYEYDATFESPYALSTASISDPGFVYTGDGDGTNPTFTLVDDPTGRGGKSLSMLGRSMYPIYKINFGGDILSKPGKYTFVIHAYSGAQSLSGRCRFLLNRAYQNVPEMGGITFGSNGFGETAYSFTVCTPEEFDASGLSDESFTTTNVFAFRYLYLFLFNGNGQTCCFDDLEMWYEEYADITFVTDSDDNYVKDAADQFMTLRHRSIKPDGALPTFDIPGSDYELAGWSRTKDGSSGLEKAAAAGTYTLYAVYKKGEPTEDDNYLSVFEAIPGIAKLHASLFGHTDEVSDSSFFKDCLAYAEKYDLMPSLGFPNYGRSILRSEFAEMLDKALPASAKKPINTVTSIPDVPAYEDYAASVYTLYRAGIATGAAADGSFAPLDKMLYDDYITWIKRYNDASLREHFTLTEEVQGKTVETMLYDTESREAFDAMFISAPTSFLSATETLPASKLTLGSWLMTSVTRSHIRRDFSIGKTVSSAYVEWQSDNPFDLYINGRLVPESENEDGWHLTGLVDIAGLLVSGTNRVGIRGFTSDELMRTVSAMRGTIVITYTDGTTLTVPSDGTWKNGTVCGFWTGTEPSGWETASIPTNYSGVKATALHPRQLRRSCYFRKDFTTTKPVKKAYLYATAKGLYVPYLNGDRLTESRFLPGAMKDVTEYQKFDVTAYVRDGYNVLGAETGNGFINCSSWGSLGATTPALLMQLEIEYTDGTTEIICTDPTWQVAASPLTDNDLQFGERYDARLEIPSWCESSIPTGTWVNAAAASVSSLMPFYSQNYEPVRIVREDRAIDISTVYDGEYVCYDFGTNFAGRAKITLKNTKPGEVIEIRYAEILDGGNPVVGVYSDVYFEKDNLPESRSPYGGRNIDAYICKGAEEEVYCPEFAYTGFRYVYIKGYSGKYDFNTVKRVEMHNDLTQVGDFTTSDARLTKIWDAVKRSYRSNIFGGPTDCPTREKNFWNGDIQMFANTACWYMDNSAIFSRWTQYGKKMEYDVYGWEDEEYILPLILYRYYGDIDTLRAKYPVIKKLISKRESQKGSNPLPTDHASYRDHQAIVNVPEDFYAAAFYCRMYHDCAEIAEILGETADAAAFAEKFETARAAFNKKYYLAASCDYTPKSQSGIILPVAFGLANEADIPRLMETLHKYVVARDYHFTCGFTSMEYALGLLCEYGYEDDAYRIITNDSYPSLLNMLTTHTGGTTTEGWVGFDTTSGNSMNHYAIGGISRWFFEYLGGMKITKPGFEEVSIVPYFYEELGDSRVTYDSDFGTIETAWEYDPENAVFNWTVTVPAGVTAVCGTPDGRAFFRDGRIEQAGTTYTLSGETRTFAVTTTQKSGRPAPAPASYDETYGQLIYYTDFGKTAHESLADVSVVPFDGAAVSSADGYRALKAGNTDLMPGTVGLELTPNGSTWSYIDGTPIKGKLTMLLEGYTAETSLAAHRTVSAPGSTWGDYTSLGSCGTFATGEWKKMYSASVILDDGTCRFGILSQGTRAEYYRIAALYVQPENALWLTSDFNGSDRQYVLMPNDTVSLPTEYCGKKVEKWTDGTDIFAAGEPIVASALAGKTLYIYLNLEWAAKPAEYDAVLGQLIYFTNFGGETGFTNLADVTAMPNAAGSDSGIVGYHARKVNAVSLDPVPIGFEFAANGSEFTYTDGTPIKGNLSTQFGVYSANTAKPGAYSVAYPGDGFGDAWGAYHTDWQRKGNIVPNGWGTLGSTMVGAAGNTRVGILTDKWYETYVSYAALYVANPTNALWLTDENGDNRSFVVIPTDTYTFPDTYENWTDGIVEYSSGEVYQTASLAGRTYRPVVGAFVGIYAEKPDDYDESLGQLIYFNNFSDEVFTLPASLSVMDAAKGKELAGKYGALGTDPKNTSTGVLVISADGDGEVWKYRDGTPVSGTVTIKSLVISEESGRTLYDVHDVPNGGSEFTGLNTNWNATGVTNAWKETKYPFVTSNEFRYMGFRSNSWNGKVYYNSIAVYVKNPTNALWLTDENGEKRSFITVNGSSFVFPKYAEQWTDGKTVYDAGVSIPTAQAAGKTFAAVGEMQDIPDSPDKPKQKNIICIGDSLTEGDYGSNPPGTMNVHAENYPYFLASVTGAKVANYGKCGYTPQLYWNNTIRNVPMNEDTDVILIMLGTNGGLSDTLENDTAAARYEDYAETSTGCYAKIIEYCKARTASHAQIILMTPPVSTLRDKAMLEGVCDVVGKLAEKYDLDVIDNYHNCGITYDNIETYMPVDGLHCNKEGYEQLAAYIAEQLAVLNENFKPVLPYMLDYTEIDAPFGTVGRWYDRNIDGKDCKVTISQGAECYFKVEGTTQVSIRTHSLCAQPPYIAVSVDGAAPVRMVTPLVGDTLIAEKLDETKPHIIRLVVDGFYEYQGSKYATGNGFALETPVVDAGGSITGLLPNDPVIMYFGDSITEGINVLGTGSTPNVNAASLEYPFVASNLLGCVSYTVGIGGSGVTKGGTAGSPKCLDAIDMIVEGVALNAPAPRAIVVNHGYNDPTENFVAEYTAVLRRLREKYPETPIFAVMPFAGVHALDIKEAVKAAADDNVYYIAISGLEFTTSDGVHPDEKGAKAIGTALAYALNDAYAAAFGENIGNKLLDPNHSDTSAKSAALPAAFDPKYGQLVYATNFAQDGTFDTLADVKKLDFRYDMLSSVSGYTAMKLGQTDLAPQPVGIELAAKSGTWHYADGTPMTGKATMYIELYTDDDATAGHFTVAAPASGTPDWGDYFTSWSLASGKAAAKNWAKIYSTEIDLASYTRFGILSNNWKNEYVRVLGMYIMPDNALWLTADDAGTDRAFVFTENGSYTFPDTFGGKTVKKWTNGVMIYEAGVTVSEAYVAAKTFYPYYETQYTAVPAAYDETLGQLIYFNNFGPESVENAADLVTLYAEEGKTLGNVYGALGTDPGNVSTGVIVASADGAGELWRYADGTPVAGTVTLRGSIFSEESGRTVWDVHDVRNNGDEVFGYYTNWLGVSASNTWKDLRFPDVASDAFRYAGFKSNSWNGKVYYSHIAVYVKNPPNALWLAEDADGNGRTFVTVSGDTYTFPTTSGKWTDGRDIYLSSQSYPIASVAGKTFYAADAFAMTITYNASVGRLMATFEGKQPTAAHGVLAVYDADGRLLCTKMTAVSASSPLRTMSAAVTGQAAYAKFYALDEQLRPVTAALTAECTQ